MPRSTTTSRPPSRRGAAGSWSGCRLPAMNASWTWGAERGASPPKFTAVCPDGYLVGADPSTAMVEAASMWLAEHAPGAVVVQADGAALPFQRAFDAVFSGATFHWILDHAALFRSIVTALKPGGRLVAQCGGAGNLAMLRGRADRLRQDPRFASFYDEWVEPWYYADVESTKRRLAAAGFAGHRRLSRRGADAVRGRRGIQGLRRHRLRAPSPRPAAGAASARCS